MNKKVIGLGLGLMMVCSMMVGCSDGENARYQDKRESKQALSNSRAIVGSPEIRYFTEKKNLKEILELRDNPKLVCHYYTKNTMTGKYIYQGKCSGYGIPYASSFTTPNDSEGEPIPDPNGMYMQGLSTTATWIAHINDKGEKEIRYIEEEITVTQSKIDKRLCEEWSLPSNY